MPIRAIPGCVCVRWIDRRRRGFLVGREGLGRLSERYRSGFFTFENVSDVYRRAVRATTFAPRNVRCMVYVRSFAVFDATFVRVSAAIDESCASTMGLDISDFPCASPELVWSCVQKSSKYIKGRITSVGGDRHVQASSELGNLRGLHVAGHTGTADTYIPPHVERHALHRTASCRGVRLGIGR